MGRTEGDAELVLRAAAGVAVVGLGMIAGLGTTVGLVAAGLEAAIALVAAGTLEGVGTPVFAAFSLLCYVL